MSESISAAHSGRSRSALWSMSARAVPTTSADDELIPEASGRSESISILAGRSSPKFRVSRSMTVCT